MLRPQKEKFVDDVTAELEKSAGVLFVDFTGMDVEEQTDFRVKMREANVRYQVVKNTLMLRALQATGVEDASAILKGTPTGVVYGYDDPIAAAKIAVEFKKNNEKLKLKGAVLELKTLDAKGAEGLAKMPGRQEMLAELLGLILGQGGSLQALLKGPAGKLVGAIEAKGESDSSEEA